MGTRYLIDTNALLEYVAALLPPGAHAFVETALNGAFIVSIVNRIEVLGHASATPALTEFMDLATTLPLDDAVAERTISLRKTYKIKLPDAIIAATALVYDLTIISRNKKDFAKIADLTCVDPRSV